MLLYTAMLIVSDDDRYILLIVLGDPTKSRVRYDDVPWVLLDDGRVVILYHWIDGGGVLLVLYYYYCYYPSLISYIGMIFWCIEC